jgi:hypothetical protein
VIPSTMWAALLHGVADVRLESVAVPEPGPGEVLVRIEACGICPTDARKYATGLNDGAYAFNLGHEWVGPATAVPERHAGNRPYPARDPDTWQLVLRHERGALASVLASHATPAYRRPAIELYGKTGTANLLGDDWDPAGLEVWRDDGHVWELREPEDATWLWTDGLREAVLALHGGRAPLDKPELDVHLIDVIAACGVRAAEARTVSVSSRFPPWIELRPEREPAGHHVHDRTRPADEQ